MNTAAKVHDLSASAGLLHGEENIVYGGSGYQGIDKRPETNNKASTFRVGRRPVGHGLRMDRPEERLDNLIKMARAIIRARVEHPFKIMKQQFGFQKTPLRCQVTNLCKIHLLAALNNLHLDCSNFNSATSRERLCVRTFVSGSIANQRTIKMIRWSHYQVASIKMKVSNQI